MPQLLWHNNILICSKKENKYHDKYTPLPFLESQANFSYRFMIALLGMSIPHLSVGSTPHIRILIWTIRSRMNDPDPPSLFPLLTLSLHLLPPDACSPAATSRRSRARAAPAATGRRRLPGAILTQPPSPVTRCPGQHNLAPPPPQPHTHTASAEVAG